MSDSSRRTFLRGVATTGIAAVGLGAAGTATADDTKDRTIWINGQEETEYILKFYRPDDDDSFRRVSGSIGDGEWVTHKTKGKVYRFAVYGDAALYTENLDEAWFDEHNLANPNYMTVMGEGEAEYTIKDGKGNEISGTVPDDRETYTIDTGIDWIDVYTPDDGDFTIYG